jgi:hypothetical protein
MEGSRFAKIFFVESRNQWSFQTSERGFSAEWFSTPEEAAEACAKAVERNGHDGRP